LSQPGNSEVNLRSSSEAPTLPTTEREGGIPGR